MDTFNYLKVGSVLILFLVGLTFLNSCYPPPIENESNNSEEYKPLSLEEENESNNSEEYKPLSLEEELARIKAETEREIQRKKPHYLASLDEKIITDSTIMRKMKNLGEELPYYMGVDWKGTYFDNDSTVIVFMTDSTYYNEYRFTKRTFAAKIFDENGPRVLEEMYDIFSSNNKVKYLQVTISSYLVDITNEYYYISIPDSYGYRFEKSIYKQFLDNEITIRELVKMGEVIDSPIYTHGDRIEPIWE